jgi:hypothetical protein
MLIASWKITLIFTAILILKILFLTHSISKRIKVVGKVRASVQAKLYEIINRIFGNSILDCLKYNKTTSNKTIREKPLVSINNLGKSFKKL